MYLSKHSAQGQISRTGRRTIFCILLAASSLLAAGCGVRYDMQDQPRYEVYRESDFFDDHSSSRDYPEGTVARGLLKGDKAFYTGKIDNPNPNAPVESTVNAQGNTIVTTFPNMIDEFPIPVTKELIDRGQERYNIYCIVCHGATGNGDGMIVRRGFPAPPTYHDDRLRNAPVGHFFDVMTNGFGKMNSYAAQVQPADRWAIVAYIRALQISQNPDEISKMNANPAANTAAPKGTPAATPGGGH
ncbi:MAG: cytochrome c [Acidobacteria bacterium]|nr:cytochrome c [Acidobacteriota bacterium]